MSDSCDGVAVVFIFAGASFGTCVGANAKRILVKCLLALGVAVTLQAFLAIADAAMLVQI